MNERDEEYFNILTKDRADSANTLEKPSMRGVKRSVVDKYSDQAHFVYELIQNADDAHATFARFVLCKDKLIFAHNGTRRFSISNPNTEEEDSKNNKLGDINAITSIANSNKNEASIGKFGVGFKSVFQYTLTPHIYDPNINFKIERFIVPIRLDEDFKERNEDETLFVFPFDHSEQTAEQAYIDISEKLCSLDFPLLFLTHLKGITFQIADTLGEYSKSVAQKRQFGDTIAECISLTKNQGTKNNVERLWLFSREVQHKYTYSVGFFIDEKGKLIAKQHSAFCFFPTKEVSGLNFVVHAPFLLTDSREGIRAGIEHNNIMIDLLATLAADSLIFLKKIGEENHHPLITDDIFDIIPYNEENFTDVNDKRKISFKPFFTAIRNKMSEEELLPTSDGYTAKENAYWAFVPQIAEVFTNEQLAQLTNNEEAQWVFRSFGRQDTQRKDKALTKYIEGIVSKWLDENALLNGWTNDGSMKRIGGISSSFIELQTITWLHSFYKWISETSNRTNIIKTKPIFLNADKKATAALDSNNHIILFLPTDTQEYNTILPELLENEHTEEFVKKLGIKEPSLYDEVYNKILPIYRNNNSGICTEQHFKKIFDYYKNCNSKEADNIIMLIKDCAFIRYHSEEDGKVYRGTANKLYFPNDKLRKWFQAKPSTNFVELDDYIKLVGEDNKEDLLRFLSHLGVSSEPRVIHRNLSMQEVSENNIIYPYSTAAVTWIEKDIDGCKELMELIVKSNNPKLSIMLWNQLIKFVTYGYGNNLRNIMKGSCKYFYYTSKSEEFESIEAIRLKTYPWLMNNDGEFMSANQLSVQNLSSDYDISTDEAVELIRYLNIKDVEGSEDDNLTDEQREKIQLANELADIPKDEIERFIKEYHANKIINSQLTNNSGNLGNENDNCIVQVVKDITTRVTSASKEINNDKENKIKVKIDADEDEYTKPSIDFTKKIEQAKQRSAKEIAEIALLDELTQKVMLAPKYSYGWFKTLLELEKINNGENNSNSREISIAFSKVEREIGTSRTLILKHPSRYIPQSLEDLADIPLELHFANPPTIKVPIEVINVKSYTLRVKLKTNAQIEGIDLSLVKEARIEARNPVFLLEELKKSFDKLGYNDNYNLKYNLCDNIEFIFGPPGTGKTTYLAKECILPLIKEISEVRILVLTPTNKAADVLVRRIMEIMDKDHSYLDWLIRFGATNDTMIEQSGVFRDKTFDIRSLTQNVTVTTIARFPYDYFIADENTRLHISELNWDYIIIDEASMIPLVNIIYPLYKKKPKKFIIAGDPFQIEPITTVGIWKNENIYTMVELNSFKKPTTVPHDYKVIPLTVQYRSVPEIGYVFSELAYEGILSHYRLSSSRKVLGIEDKYDIRSLNIIKFPISKYESIYRPKRLQSKSNYQIYSALFTFEFIKYISSLIEDVRQENVIRIGLIAPYRAQADLIDKLMSSYSFPKCVEIQVGTIHGFQGDECDIIFALFNPPPNISDSNEMFLNKLNIINVSISRARDYLFIIMPDDNTEDINNLTMIKKVEELCKQKACSIQETHTIESIIFNNETYIEDNSFSTSHQTVNVYEKPEKKYEVRSEENAVDVQIHD